jgi:hypothetical protein
MGPSTATVRETNESLQFNESVIKPMSFLPKVFVFIFSLKRLAVLRVEWNVLAAFVIRMTPLRPKENNQCPPFCSRLKEMRGMETNCAGGSLPSKKFLDLLLPAF